MGLRKLRSFGAVTTIVGLFLQLCCASGLRAQDAERLVASAEDAFVRREYARATDLLEQLRAEQPTRREIDFNLGVTEQAAGHYSLAARHFNLYAQSLSPRDAREVSQHASMLSRYDQWQASGGKTRRRFPWWGWVIIGGGATLVAAAVAVMMVPDDSGEEYY